METLNPKTVIIYEGKDVSSDFEPILKSVTFKDYLDGKASEVSLTLSNSGGYFFGDWYPLVDDRLSVMLGYQGAEMIDAGDFWIDETDLYGGRNGDEFVMRAMSLKSSFVNADTNKIIYKEKPIADIATRIADEMGCRITGDLSGNYTGVQNETNLTFLSRLARETGRILKIEGNTIIMYQLSAFGKNKILSIKRSDTLSYRVSDVASGRITSVTVKWWDRKQKKLIEGTYDIEIKGGGSVVEWQEVNSQNDAVSRAKDILASKNKSGISFTIDLVGDVHLRSGIDIDVSGFGRFDGVYYISEAEHIINKQGYITTITLQKNDRNGNS